jgi:hypothetical protein
MKKIILSLALCFYCGHYGYGVETAPLQQAKCKDFLDKCSQEWQQQFMDALRQYSTLNGNDKNCILNNADRYIDRVCEYYRFYSVLSTVKMLHTACEEGKVTDEGYEEIAEGIRHYMRTHPFPMADDTEQDKLEIAGSVLYTTLTLQKEEFVEIMRAVPEIVEFIMQIDKTAYIPLNYYLIRHEALYLSELDDPLEIAAFDEAAWERELAKIHMDIPEDEAAHIPKYELEKIVAIKAAFDENTRRITDFLEPRLGVLQRLSQKREENSKGGNVYSRMTYMRTYRDY